MNQHEVEHFRDPAGIFSAETLSAGPPKLFVLARGRFAGGLLFGNGMFRNTVAEMQHRGPKAPRPT
jgi:hypothetical protein